MFQGSIVALVTPMDERGRIDLEAVDRLVDFHLERGSDGLVVAGTTGESATLGPDETHRLLERVLSRANGRIAVLAGTGGPATTRVVQQTRQAAALGVDGALVVTPYYNRPTQAGLEAHYRTIAESTDLPIVLYNVPGRTGVDLQPETVERLAQVPGIVALKEAVGDMVRVDELVARCGDRINILSGDDPTCLEAIGHGARGVVSVAANVVPGRMAAMCRAAIAGDPGAADIDADLRALYAALAFETNPIPVKWSIYLMGLAQASIRLPLQPLAERHRNAMASCLADLDIRLAVREE